MKKRNAYGMDTEDKRIFFMVVSVVITFVVFFASLAALEDKSWSPLIRVGQVGGVVIGTIAFFCVVIRVSWAAAKKIFPDN